MAQESVAVPSTSMSIWEGLVQENQEELVDVLEISNDEEEEVLPSISPRQRNANESERRNQVEAHDVVEISSREEEELLPVASKEKTTNGDIPTAVEEIAKEATRLGLDNNPVELLRIMQAKIVQGRDLEIKDITAPLEGATNQIFIDRNCVLETAMEE